MRDPTDTILEIRCMYCDEPMGTKPGGGSEGVSHSICEDCWNMHFPDIPYPTVKEKPSLPGTYSKPGYTPSPWIPSTGSPPESFNVPFKETPHWLQEAWNLIHPRTVPMVEVYRTTVARIDPPGNDYYVRDIVAHKDGRVIAHYVPSYDSLTASTPQDRSLYFGGAVRLGPGDAIATMDFWGDRYKKIDLYVHPEAYEPPKLLGPELTERQKKILASIRSYTSAYRKQLFGEHNVRPEEIGALQVLGLIDRRNAITVMGRNVIGNEQAWF
jgi:hypothetical protein